MWRYAIWFIIIGLMAMLLIGYAIVYWRNRRDTLEDQDFEREVMEHERKMRDDDDA